MSHYDNWKTTNPQDELEELPENWDELTEEEQKEIKDYMAMSPARQRRYNAL